MPKKRVGILTSGGDAPGMNAAIRAVFRRVKMISPDNEVVLFREGLNGLAGRLEVNFDRNIDRTRVRDIIHRGGTFIGTGRLVELADPPDALQGPERETWLLRQREIKDTAVVNLRQLGLDAIVVIGGDGSFKGCASIASAYQERFRTPLRVVGVPATIDNDIWGTEFSIGFDTALNNTVDALRKLRDTIDSHRRCAVLEVMGNTSGWIALSAGIAGGAVTIMLPEVPETYDPEQVLERIRTAARLDYRYIIVVMAEGVRKVSGRPRLGEELVRLIEEDVQIREALGRPLEARLNTIGYLARGGHPTAFDNLLASRLGVAAADQALTGETAPVMVGLVNNQIAVHPLSDATTRSPRLIMPDDELLSVAWSLLVHADQPF
jgi:6-phosphofructokinase 1